MSDSAARRVIAVASGVGGGKSTLVQVPLTGAQRAMRQHVIFEAPFGRWHAKSGRYIDTLVWIDTPLDIALARKVRQLVATFDGPSASLAPWLREYLANYLEGVEALLRVQRERVRPGADIVVDGLEGPEVVARQVVRALSECA